MGVLWHALAVWVITVGFDPACGASRLPRKCLCTTSEADVKNGDTKAENGEVQGEEESVDPSQIIELAAGRARQDSGVPPSPISPELSPELYLPLENAFVFEPEGPSSEELPPDNQLPIVLTADGESCLLRLTRNDAYESTKIKSIAGCSQPPDVVPKGSMRPTLRVRADDVRESSDGVGESSDERNQGPSTSRAHESENVRTAIRENAGSAPTRSSEYVSPGLTWEEYQRVLAAAEQDPVFLERIMIWCVDCVVRYKQQYEYAETCKYVEAVLRGDLPQRTAQSRPPPYGSRERIYEEPLWPSEANADGTASTSESAESSGTFTELEVDGHDKTRFPVINKLLRFAKVVKRVFSPRRKRRTTGHKGPRSARVSSFVAINPLYGDLGDVLVAHPIRSNYISQSHRNGMSEQGPPLPPRNLPVKRS